MRPDNSEQNQHAGFSHIRQQQSSIRKRRLRLKKISNSKMEDESFYMLEYFEIHKCKIYLDRIPIKNTNLHFVEL